MDEFIGIVDLFEMNKVLEREITVLIEKYKLRTSFYPDISFNRIHNEEQGLLGIDVQVTVTI